jgi:formylglycine-generating enzyme required for sulfatase activity
VLAPDATPLAPGTVSELTSVDSTRLVFSANTPGTDDLTVGKVLFSGITAQTPDGLLRKITARNVQGDELILTTEPARLTEAVQKGAVSGSFALSLADTATGVRQKGLSVTRVTEDAFTLAFTDYEPAPGIEVTGALSFQPRLDFEIVIDDWIVESFNITLSAVSTTDLSFRAGIAGQITGRAKLQQWPLNPITVPIGPLWVVVFPTLSIQVGVDGTIIAEITAGIEATQTATAGASYETGIWTPIQELEQSFSFTSPLDPTIEGNLKLFIGPRLDLRLFGTPFFVAYAELNGYARVNVAPLNDPYWALYAGVEANVGIISSLFNPEFINLEGATIFEHETLLEAGFKLTVTPETLAGVVDTDYAFTTHHQNRPTQPEYTWDFGDGTPQVAITIDTTATHAFSVPGVYDVSVTLTDTESGKEKGQASVVATIASADTVVDAGIDFVLVPAGSFQMGSTNGNSSELPVHEVVISEAFELGRYEVTQAEWESVMGSNPSSFTGDDTRPVESVSWDDVQLYIEALNAQNDGFVYRLPTEAEWEYACRAGTTGDYAGDLDAMAWYSSNSGSQTHPVGQKEPNAWGLYDMHGNVWEWVQDRYSSSYYSVSPGTDPPGPTSGSYRVHRGGAWYSSAIRCRSAYRGGDSPGDRHSGLGFRLVRTSASSPSVEITSPATGTSFPESASITFQGTATDPQDGTLAGSSLVWTSNQDGQLGTGTDLSTSSLSVNTHLITLTATDSDGNEGSASITIHVTGDVDTSAFVLVPAGSFQMGSTNGDSNELPVHEVVISEAFELGRYEVTQGRWESVMGSNPSNFTGDDTRPVESVSWHDVQAYIDTLNAQNDGFVYRLPTEAEWEYACRAGTTGDYAGDLDAMAWYNDPGGQTHPVGQKEPNAWGLYDMHGNVSEWVQDWYSSTYYSVSPGTDPPGPQSGSFRIRRGGGWNLSATYCRSSFRFYDFSPDWRLIDLGFRLVRTAQ